MQEKVYYAFESRINPLAPIEGAVLPSDLARVDCLAEAYDHLHLKILTPKQFLCRLPIALAQVKAGNTSRNSLIEIRQIYFYIEQKKLLKKYLPK